MNDDPHGQVVVVAVVIAIVFFGLIAWAVA
jgi:hypothetical protein